MKSIPWVLGRSPPDNCPRTFAPGHSPLMDNPPPPPGQLPPGHSPRSFAPRTMPTFEMDVWNMFDRTQDELPRTINHAEGWHWRFNDNCDGVHPNIWKFIRALQREEGIIRSEVHQPLGDHVFDAIKQYVQWDERVKNTVNTYPIRRANVFDYLGDISHNLSF